MRCNFYENERKLQQGEINKESIRDVTFMKMKGNYNQEPLFPSFEYDVTFMNMKGNYNRIKHSTEHCSDVTFMNMKGNYNSHQKKWHDN